MINYINYFNHVITAPPFFQRRFEYDVEAWQAQAKRAALLVLPFLSLHKPFGSAISLGMGASRSLSHLSCAYAEGNKGEWRECGKEAGQTALAILALSATIFHFNLGLVLTTGVDTLTSAGSACQHLYNREFALGSEEALQTLGSALYLGIMATGSLEAILVAGLLQAAISLYQARAEFSQGRYPEAFSKALMGSIRLYQARPYLDMIQRRNDLLAVQKYQQLNARAYKGKTVRHLLSNPLIDLDVRIEQSKVILADAEKKDYAFGSHFHGHGKGLVKGANLAFEKKTLEGKKMTELDFKVNHVFRDKIQSLISDLEHMNAKEIQDVLSIAGSHVKDIKVERGKFSVGLIQKGSSYNIKLEGLGSVQIGASSNYPNLYDRVIVRMDAGKTLFDLHEMLAFMDLDEALAVSSQDDITRLKMGHLFHTFCPKEATTFERTDDFFTLSLDQLKKEMVERSPEMGEILGTYLDKMQPREILPGRIRYGITGLAEEARQLGARTLTAAVRGGYDRVASILKMGMISSDTRYSHNIHISGMSSSTDFLTGGADSVFTQIITEKNCSSQMPLNRLFYYSNVQMLISLEALETGTYQYHHDSFGSRETDGVYSYRPGVREFVREEQLHGVFRGNEVMIKERIPPSLIYGMVVPDTQTRDALLQHLRMHEIVQKDIAGQERILNIPVDRFIRVGKRLNEDLVSRGTCKNPIWGQIRAL